MSDELCLKGHSALDHHRVISLVALSVTHVSCSERFFLRVLYSKRCICFNNGIKIHCSKEISMTHSISRIASTLNVAASGISNGKGFHYAKLLNFALAREDKNQPDLSQNMAVRSFLVCVDVR